MKKAARKPKAVKPKKKPTYNQNTAIRSALRRAFSRSPVVWEVLKEGRRYFAKFNKDGSRAKKDGVETHCQVCNTWVRAPIKVAVDHIQPVVPLDGSWKDDWNLYISRLWCPKENLQRICQHCHDKKTAEERVARNERKKALKNAELAKIITEE